MKNMKVRGWRGEEEDEMEIRFEIMMEPHVCWEIKSIHNQYL